MTDQTTTTALVARLLALAERFDTGHGHLDLREDIDHRGVCRQRRHYVGGTRVKDGTGFRMANQTLDGTCAPSCVEWQSAVAEARAYVAARTPRQLSAWAEGVA